jgi:hypothetical protein
VGEGNNQDRSMLVQELKIASSLTAITGKIVKMMLYPEARASLV